MTVHDNVAPAEEGKVPQFTEPTPIPGVTAVATTPVGNFSEIFKLALEAEAPVPLLPIFKLYLMVPEGATGVVAVLLKV